MSVTTLSDTVTVRRALAVTAAGALLIPATGAWDATVSAPGVSILALLITVALLVLLGLLLAAPDDERVRALEAPLLIVALTTLILVTAARLSGPASYRNDDAGFLQAAAIALTRGHDPYATNLGWAIHAYGFGVTQTADGGHWTFFSYPAVSLLIAWAVASLRSTIVVPTVVEIGALAIGTAVLFRALPERLRSLAPLVCIALPGLATHALNGLSEVMILPTMIAVAHRWRDVGRGGRLGRGGVVRAIALGLAVSTNQLAWFFVPFVLGGTFLMRRDELGARPAVALIGRYGAVALLVVAALNGPFIAWGPGSWVTDIFASFGRAELPTGEAIPVSLTLFAHVGGGDLQAYSYAFVLIYLALLATFLLGFRRLHWLCFVLPSVALWFSSRALDSYWTVPVPFVLVSVLNGGAVPRALARGPLRWRPALATAALFVPGAVALALALGTPAPLTMRLLAAPHRAHARYLTALELDVTNRSDAPLVPHFRTNDSGHTSDFWTARRGPRAIPAHATARYDLIAPNSSVGVPISDVFSIVVVSATPDTYSAQAFSPAAVRAAASGTSAPGAA